MKNEIRLTPKDTLKSAIMAQWEEQQKLNKELNEKLLNILTIEDLKKIHKLNEEALQIARKANLKEMKDIVHFGLSFMN
jgi:hypothetical protein